MATYYKYADNPTVYRGSDNYAFTSEQDFLSKGGDWNAIETRARPVGAALQGSAPSLQGSSPSLQSPSYPANFVGPKLPAPSVTTSQQARKQTTKNMASLSAYEQALSPEQSAGNLSKVYQGRTDLQGLYNPDGTAKNPNDPRIAGIPTLSDWAAKYGSGEEPLLKGFSSSPAVNAMLMQINQGLGSQGRDGAALDPATRQQISDINGLTNEELSATANARAAADGEDYRSLDLYMKELSEIRKNRDALTAELLRSVQKSDEELKLSKQLGDLDQEARNVKLGYNESVARARDKAIPMEMIRGQSENALRAANIMLERIATEQGPIINRLSLAQETRQNAVQSLQVAIQAIDQDSDMVFRLASFAQELAKTERAEREAARDFAIENDIQAPFYNLAGTVYKTDGTKAYSNEQSFYTDAGVSSFQEAYDRGLLIDVKQSSNQEYDLTDIGGVPYWVDKKNRQLIPAEGFEGYTPEDPDMAKLLSPEEAIKLGVPYGTTRGEAAGLGIMPEKTLSPEAQKLKANVESGTRALETMKSELFANYSADAPVEDQSNVRSNILVRDKVGMARNYEAAKNEILDVIVRLRTGAAITDNEEKFYRAQLPSVRDNEATVKQKLQRFESLFRDLSAQSALDPNSLFNEYEGAGGKAQGGSTPYLKTLGTITGPNGSKYWKWGLDVDLKKGDPVKSPVSGVVTFAGTNGGFGNQVKIRSTDGREIWLSHFDALGVKAGQGVTAGQVIALGGNSGRVYSSGGDGSHVDITIPKPGGGYYTAPEVQRYLSNKFV